MTFHIGNWMHINLYWCGLLRIRCSMWKGTVSHFLHLILCSPGLASIISIWLLWLSLLQKSGNIYSVLISVLNMCDFVSILCIFFTENITYTCLYRLKEAKNWLSAKIKCYANISTFTPSNCPMYCSFLIVLCLLIFTEY